MFSCLKFSSLPLAVAHFLLLALVVSLKTPVTTKVFSRNVEYKSHYQLPSFNRQYRKSSVAVLAYTDIAELNNAIRKDSSQAYELFIQQRGVINFETAYLTLAALTQKGEYESLDNVMFLMRSQYGMQTDAMMWETIIVEASKINSVIGKKYYNRMAKHGPPVTSLKAYEVLMKSLSRAENWKEVAHVYNDLQLRKDLMPVVDTGFYELMMSFNARRGRWKEAVFWMKEMDRRGVTQSHKCYRFVIDSCQKGGKQQLALEYIDVMLEVFKEEGNVGSLEK